MMHSHRDTIGILYLSDTLNDKDLEYIKSEADLLNLPLEMHEIKTRYWASIDDVIAQVHIIISNDFIKNILSDAIYSSLCKLCKNLKNKLAEKRLRKFQGDKVIELNPDIHILIKNIHFIMPYQLNESELYVFMEKAIQISNITEFQNTRYAYYDKNEEVFFFYTEQELVEKFYNEQKCKNEENDE